MTAADPVATEEQLIDGPHTLFDGSFILEFLKPHPHRKASALMRTTFKASNPVTKTGKKHPQSPPLHLHFDQVESFEVIKGSICTTQGYECRDLVHKPEDGEVVLNAYVPHTFWPDPNCDEDAVLLLWTWPKDTGYDMDVVFFRCLLMYLSDVYEGKRSLNLLRLMYLQ